MRSEEGEGEGGEGEGKGRVRFVGRENAGAFEIFWDSSRFVAVNKVA